MGKRSQHKKAKKRAAFYRNKGCDEFVLPQHEAERRRACTMEIPIKRLDVKSSSHIEQIRRQQQFDMDVITQTIFNSMIMNS